MATGRRRIAFISGLRHDAASRVRLAATNGVLADNGLELAHAPLFGEWSEHWGRQAAYQLIRAGVDLDGIVCGSDQIARGVLEALRESGVDVPGQLAVTGFDNWDMVVNASRPALTSVDMNLHDVGRSAADSSSRASLARRIPRSFTSTASSSCGNPPHSAEHASGVVRSSLAPNHPA